MFGIAAMVPPPTAPGIVLQRIDEVNTVQRILSDLHTSAVFLTGDAGAGKSMLAALVYRRLIVTAQAGSPVTRHLVWLSLGPYATLPDVMAAILASVDVDTAGFSVLKPEIQLKSFFNALRDPQESAFVVLDQFEHLLDPETCQGLVGRGALSLFFDMLQADLGGSRLLLTCYRSPYGPPNERDTHVRSYLVSRISLPEGVALLQQRGVQGLPEELSTIWQRCAGHTFALVLFTALVHLTGYSLSYLLNAPEYQPLWSSQVTLHLSAAVYRSLKPIQRTLMRALCFFSEPVPFEGIMTTITGNNAPFDVSAFEYELDILTQLALVRQSLNDRGIASYALPPLLRQYIIATYLEGMEHHPEQNQYFLPGVSGPSAHSMNGSEAQGVALAAGHVQVASYYQRLAQAQCPPREKRTGPHDVEPLLEAIRHLCLGWRWQQACDLLFAEGLHESMVQWRAWDTLIQLYSAMLPPPGVLTRHDEALLASSLGMLYGRLGNYEESHNYFEQALANQREIGDQHGEVISLLNQGEIFRNENAWTQARSNFEQALFLNRQLQDILLESVLLHNLGLVCHGEKDYQQALRYYLESFQLMNNLKTPDLQDPYKGGMILTNIGMLLYEQGQQAEALATLLLALQIRQSIQDPTINSLETFLRALEQKMGPEAFAQLYQTAQDMQQEVFSRLLAANMRQ